MDMDNLNILQNMYDSLLQDREDENKKLCDNLNTIEQINGFLQTVKDDPESDFRVFSPRSSESIHRDSIEQHETEKSILVKENDIHNRRINKLDKQIEELGALIQNISCADFKNKKELSNDESKHIWMLDIQEKERQRIARELHDSSVQNLTHLIHTIELSSLFIDQDPIRAKLELASCSKNLKSVINEMREIIFNLHPMSFDDLGFQQSIEDFINNLKQKFDTDCRIDYTICSMDSIIPNQERQLDENYNDSGRFDRDQYDLILVTIYRLIQEALLNALKYSGADYIKLNVEPRDNNFYITIKDNGKGFSLDKVLEQKDRHFGITVMKERVYLLNGDISIDTAPEQGTEIRIEIPFK